MTPRPRPVSGTVRVPGSKSLTQRAILAAALADGDSLLENALVADDSRHLLDALENVGIGIARESGGTTLAIKGSGGRFGPPHSPLFVGNAGTAMRFLAPVLSLGSGPFDLVGDERMEERPIADLVDALRTLGADVRYENREGFPPLWIAGGGLRGGSTRLRGNQSSQYLTGILLAAPCAAAPVDIEVEGPLVSRSYVELTLDVQRAFGISVRREGDRRFHVPAPQSYRARRYVVEGDWSSASYFFAAAAITGGSVTVRGLHPDSAQGDARFVDLLERMGARVRRETDGVTLEGGTELRAIDADLADLPDVAPTLAIVAACAIGTTRVRGVGHLRIKESDRIHSIVAELRRLGADATPHDDGFEVRGGATLHGGEVETYADHRIAMSFATLGLVTPGVTVRDVACVSKSYPRFFEDLARLRT
ncbi:MAG: 3-phosphoshikimate 1-carboxyvinyltransferase [Planctomycetes bacterium]|nr:3-phosphoshikimate 1-carboxyvinyltransferase [Planctomycetota bacterium]MBI3845038.1 3-phosphoshikimate 1-carboxyvinyltransferase [Planctomycetota bacterium]